MNANQWWRSLSINQMKAFQDKYFPRSTLWRLPDHWIVEIWNKENNPPPEILIPVEPFQPLLDVSVNGVLLPFRS